jgi:xanthine dehydrogenase accessory factor
MMKLLQSICHLLEEGEDAVLATIIDHSDSTPRSVGTKMVVRPDRAIIGTIGGGFAEFHARKLASEVFKTGKALTEPVDLPERTPPPRII